MTASGHHQGSISLNLRERQERGEARTGRGLRRLTSGQPESAETMTIDERVPVRGVGEGGRARLARS